MTLADYSRPSRVGYANQQGAGSTPVKVSFVGCGGGDNEKIAFNYGRELFVYPYRGVRRSQEAKVIDKRVYKGTSPTCHDFGPLGCLRSESSDVIPLLVGFTGGQVHLIDPVNKELSRLFNEERIIDKTKVTCIKWAPGRGDMFVVSHASGQLYTYLADTDCHALQPQYQVVRQGEGYTYYTCKTKPIKNPISRCNVNGSYINEFSFSPCGEYLATVSQDGFLRIFHFDSMELIGTARSYFGGLLCCSWSPDGRFIVVGGEDDLVTVYSVQEKRVVVRGQGHRSWVSVVTFDIYTLAYGEVPDGLDFSGSDDEGVAAQSSGPQAVNSPQTSPRGLVDHLTLGGLGGERVVRGARARVAEEGGGNLSDNTGLNISGLKNSSMDVEDGKRSRKTSYRDSAFDEQNVTCYRFGSVGQDTMICLWDLTEDIIKLSQAQLRSKWRSKEEESSLTSKDSGLVPDGGTSSAASLAGSSDKPSSTSSLSQKLATLNFGSSNKESTGHKRAFSLPGRTDKKDTPGRGRDGGRGQREHGTRSHGFPDTSVCDTIGSPGCPRLCDTPILEPIVVKKIAHERLTALLFREECIVTACQDGYVCTWARPSHTQVQASPGANQLLANDGQSEGGGGGVGGGGGGISSGCSSSEKNGDGCAEGAGGPTVAGVKVAGAPGTGGGGIRLAGVVGVGATDGVGGVGVGRGGSGTVV